MIQHARLASSLLAVAFTATMGCAGTNSGGGPRSRPAAAGGESAPEADAASPASVSSAAMTDRDSGVAYWEGRLDQSAHNLSSTGTNCREICRASGDICTAAHEICVLTGDGEARTPTDPRCARARAVCEQASRQRDGACPICPAI